MIYGDANLGKGFYEVGEYMGIDRLKLEPEYVVLARGVFPNGVGRGLA